MDEATARAIFNYANRLTTPTLILTPDNILLDLTQFWLDHHEVGGQDVGETKQVNVYAKVEDGNG
jgi:hypothetical protein